MGSRKTKQHIYACKTARSSHQSRAAASLIYLFASNEHISLGPLLCIVRAASAPNRRWMRASALYAQRVLYILRLAKFHARARLLRFVYQIRELGRDTMMWQARCVLQSLNRVTA